MGPFKFIPKKAILFISVHFNLFYLDMIGALVSTLANLLTNETDVVRSVAPGLPLDVLGE